MNVTMLDIHLHPSTSGYDTLEGFPDAEIFAKLNENPLVRKLSLQGWDHGCPHKTPSTNQTEYHDSRSRLELGCEDNMWIKDVCCSHHSDSECILDPSVCPFCSLHNKEYIRNMDDQLFNRIEKEILIQFLS